MDLLTRIAVKSAIASILLMLQGITLSGQDTILLDNPSFEAAPFIGNLFYPFKEWKDCMASSGESPPDVHAANTNFWEVTQNPLDGKTFLGMVTRKNETTEIISQRLSGVLKKDQCYELKIHLSSDPNYRSPIHENRFDTVLFNRPIVLVIWGGTTLCEKRQKLDESPPVDHAQWMEYSFKLQPQSNLNVITLEAFYETPVLFPYCGNILLDHLSEIVAIPCNKNISNQPDFPEFPGTEDELAGNVSPNKYQTPAGTSSSQSASSGGATRTADKRKSPEEISGVKVEDFLKSNQELEIKNLAFEADSFNLKPSSYQSLDQIFDFLLANPNISLEIGGHTNSLPPSAICDSLSLRRARSVRNYLVDEGIDPERLKAVGYGKRRPLVSNKTITGRAKNQRVEIKIIKR